MPGSGGGERRNVGQDMRGIGIRVYSSWLGIRG